MPLVAYQSEDRAIEEYVRCESLAAKPKFIIRKGVRLYPAICGQHKPRGQGRYWQLSESNGFMGTEAQLREQMAMDRARGVVVDYVKVKEKVSYRSGQRVGVYKAGFDNKAHKRRYLTANCRVDFDAGYGDPCPGDFRRNMPPEFHDFKVPQ